MSKLIDIFTQGDWAVSTTVLALILAQLLLAAVALIVFAILMLHKHVVSRGQGILVAREQVVKQRNLVGITLDTSAVKRNFNLGDPFDCEGLVVTANYDGEPFTEVVTDYTVEPPMMSWEGTPSVTIRYGDQTAFYTVDIQAEEERLPVGLELDDSAVRKQFTVGEPFECGGLNVFMRYSSEPLREEVFGYSVDEISTDTVGEKEVYVRYGGFVEYYTVVVEDMQTEPVAAIAEESVSSALRYDRSFTARLIQSDDDVKQWYTLLKNDLLSYGKVKARMSWKRETYKGGGNVLALFSFRGNTLCLSLALDPAEQDETRYKVEDVSANKSFAETPCMYRIKNDRRVKRASELIAKMMANYGLEKTDRIAEDYYLPYEGIVQLLNKGLAKRMLVTVRDFGNIERSAQSEAAATEAAAPVVVVTEQPADIGDAVVVEDDVEGGTLRYDKSFQARLIQSDDETKRYYSAIKNELLSYGKVKDRMSWKRETYKVNGGVIAKIGFRGNTLCLYLPLNVADYEGTTYKVEDASVNKSFEDTPCMFRIKNEKRLRMASELIEQAMSQRDVARNNRQPVDFYEPYRDIVTLITEGLVRREIKSKEEEESVFSKGKAGGNDA